MSTGLLLSIGITATLLGGIAVTASLSRGPPLRRLAAEPPAATAAPDVATIWVCVTPRSYCTSPPRREGEPCACADAMRGTTGGRVRTDRTAAAPDSGGWPGRPAEEDDAPGAGRPARP